MARYVQDEYPNQSIGDMLMRGGMMFANQQRQKEALENQNMVQALQLMSGLGKMPQNIRTNQQALAGIDQTLSKLSQGKLTLPRNTEQSLANAIQTKAASEQPMEGGMTPMGQAKPSGSLLDSFGKAGEYAPIKPASIPLVGINKATGKMENMGEMPEGAHPVMLGDTKQPIPVINRKGEVTGYLPAGPRPFVQPLTPEEISNQKRMDAKAAAEGRREVEGGLIGKPREFYQFAKSFPDKFPVEFPGKKDLEQWSWQTVEKIKEAMSNPKDYEAQIHNRAWEMVPKYLAGDRKYNDNRTPPEEKRKMEEDTYQVIRKRLMVPGQMKGDAIVAPDNAPPPTPETAMQQLIKQANDPKHPRQKEIQKGLEQRGIKWQQ